MLVVARPSGRSAAGAWVLAAFAVGFALTMTFSAKPFDRYLLPAFPAVDLLAGLGLWRAITRIAGKGRRTAALGALAIGVVGLSAWWLLSAWPYVLTYKNPLARSLTSATEVVTSGWGEGLDQVAAYLNAKPNASRLKVGMPGEIYTTVLAATFHGQVGPAEGADAAVYDYLVVYTRNRQLGERPPFFDERFLRWIPEATVSLSGVEYAWIYNTSAGAPVAAVFGERIELEGYGLSSTALQRGRTLELRLGWRQRADLPRGLQLVIELRPTDAAGITVSRTLPLEQSQADGAAPGRLIRTNHAIHVDPGVPSGPYVLAVAIVDGQGQALPLTQPPERGPQARAETHAVELRGIEVR
jgi:hypothetical protein